MYYKVHNDSPNPPPASFIKKTCTEGGVKRVRGMHCYSASMFQVLPYTGDDIFVPPTQGIPSPNLGG